MKSLFYLSELDSVAKNLIDSLSTKIIRIDGVMGSGKTTLISSACKHLNIQDEISSPTFSIVNTYSSPKGPVYHFDFYRLEDKREAFDIGVESYFDSSAYCFIEWPSMIEDLLLDDFDHIYIDLENEKRIIKLVLND